MVRGKQKMEAQKRNEKKKKKAKVSQLEARAAAFKLTCPICKVPLVDNNQLGDHYEAKHPKEKPPEDQNVAESSNNLPARKATKSQSAVSK